jgi:hypothetical protein
MRKGLRKIGRRIMKYIDKNFFSDKFSVDLKFLIVHKRKINWKNPKSFNEKIQWRKLYDRKPFYTMCADRFKVRDYVRVDLYSVKNKIYFGELTLTPAAGFQKLLPYPYWDYEIGKNWTLKKEDEWVRSKK